MNDYVETPEGHKLRLIRPPAIAPLRALLDGHLRRPGAAGSDGWRPPEPPESA